MVATTMNRRSGPATPSLHSLVAHPNFRWAEHLAGTSRGLFSAGRALMRMSSSRPAGEALKLQRPLPDQTLKVVGMGREADKPQPSQLSLI
jgi:hypothetical protein